MESKCAGEAARRPGSSRVVFCVPLWAVGNDGAARRGGKSAHCAAARLHPPSPCAIHSVGTRCMYMFYFYVTIMTAPECCGRVSAVRVDMLYSSVCTVNDDSATLYTIINKRREPRHEGEVTSPSDLKQETADVRA